MASVVISHWHQRFENTQLSSMEFYEEMYQQIISQKLPDISLGRITYSETGMFSAQREYFRIQRNEFIFDICAAPFGTNFFISYWLSEASGCFVAIISRIPIIGAAWAKRLLRKTFYEQDTEIMFKESIQGILKEVINTIESSGRGLRRLQDEEFKPQIDNLLRN